MDSFFRFSDYDVFAYLAAGIAALLAWDYTFGSHWIIGANWSAASGTTIVLVAYIVGHIVAWPASWLLERCVVRCVLGPPSRALLGEPPPGRFATIKQALFPDYFTPLDRPLAERVRFRAAREGQPGLSGQSLFWTAFAHSKHDVSTYSRMTQFLKLYGFCRNIAFVGVTAAIMIATGALWRAANTSFSTDVGSRLLWAALVCVAGVAMFYRYLKFHRLYTVEVFVGYANISAERQASHEGARP